MAEETWDRVAHPILEYINANGGPTAILDMKTIAEGTGLDVHNVTREVERLCGAEYLAGEVVKLMSGGDPSPWFLSKSDLGEKGLRAIGVWPSEDPYDALVELLDRVIAQTADPDERSRWERVKTTLGEIGKATVSGFLIQWATRGLPH